MDGGSWLQVFIILILILFGAYFGAAESAISSMNKIKIKNLADSGDKRAKKALYVANNFDRALTTLLIGNNITKIACASFATVLSIKFIVSPNPELISTIITTAVVFLFCEMLPKSYANSHPLGVSLAFASSLRILMKIFTPLSFFFSWISKVVSKLFSRNNEPSITEDELFEIIDNIEEEGTIDEEQSDLFKSALVYSNTTVKDVMTPRDDIVAIDVSSSVEDIIETVRSVKFSRIPVFEGTIDNTIGILNVKKFLKAYVNREPVSLRHMLSRTQFVSPDALIDNVLSDMSKNKIYMSVVKNDKETLGIVTVEDFLEELVGEIWDEDDVVDKRFFKLGGNRYLVDGSYPYEEMLEKITAGAVTCDAEVKDSGKTVATWILENISRVPSENEELEIGPFEITVDELDGNRISKVVFRYNPEHHAQDAENVPEKKEND